MVVLKDHIYLNYLKLTYQIISLIDLEKKHNKLTRIYFSLNNLFLLNELSKAKILWTQKYGFIH